MGTNFPTSNDAFSVPNQPASTPLNSSGSSTRAHTQSHQDLGDAIVAVQSNVPLLTHDHSGGGSRATNKLLQANTHQSPDTDSSTTALHHTLGMGASQAARGTHIHDGVSGVQLDISTILNLSSLLPVKIAQYTSPGGNSSFSVPLASSYTNIFCLWSAKSTDTTGYRADLVFRPNGVSGGAYGGMYSEFRTTGLTTGPTSGLVGAQVGLIPTSRSGTAGLMASGLTIVNNWNNSTYWSNILSIVNETAAPNVGSDPGLLTGLYSTVFNNSNTSKTSMTVVLSIGDFVSGASFTFYGI